MSIDPVYSLETIITEKRRRLHHLQVRKAKSGIQTDPEVLTEIEDLEAEIEQLQHKLDQEYRQRTQLIFRANDLDLEPAPFAQGLILLLSPLRHNQKLADLSTYRAIEHHKATLRSCWLIATQGLTNAEPTAQQLVEHFSQAGQEQGLVIEWAIRLIKNGGDALETQLAVESIYAEIERQNQQDDFVILTDITGGTNAMTVGAALACGTKRPMQYMLYQKDANGAMISAPVLLHTHIEEEL